MLMGLEGSTQKMEFDAWEPHSDIVDTVSKLAEVSKFRSIGVFPSLENADQGHVKRLISKDDEKSIDNVLERSEFDGTKQNAKSAKGRNGSGFGHVEISKLFDVLLDLKLAYVKFQEAHVPYDPKKIRAADWDVVATLDALSKIKKAYKEKLEKQANPFIARSALLLAEIQAKEGLLEKLKCQVKNKDAKLTNLRQKLRVLEAKNEKLAQEGKGRERECLKVLDNQYSLENVAVAAGKAIHEFAKPLIALMKASNWDLDRAVEAVQESVAYGKRSHKKYAFEAYVSRRMFHSSFSRPGTWENVMITDDPIESLVRYPQSDFAKFVRTKYLLVVHPEMEASFFGNLDHRTFVSNGIHPQTPFYRAFVRMAGRVWLLLGLTVFNEPKAEIFGVRRGSKFSNLYMDVVDELKDFKNMRKKESQVEFMVMPGFKLGKTLVKAQVYVSSC